MKKVCLVVILLSISIALFSACSKAGDQETTSLSTTVMGEVAKSYFNQYDEGKTIVYETDNRETLKLEHYDKSGALKYIECYLYDDYGSLYGYSYYDKDQKFVARYLFAGEKIGYFFEDDTFMNENEFSRRMNDLGAHTP